MRLAFLNSCSKHSVAKIINGDDQQWCSLYIGKEFHVKPFINQSNESVDFLYSIVKCKHNKNLLTDAEWNRVKYPNAWGITLTVRTDNVAIKGT